MHKNLHSSHSSRVQRFLNVLYDDSYIRPHRHTLDPKTETIIVVSGVCAILLFDDLGATQSVDFVSNDPSYGDCFGVEIRPNSWYTVLSLTTYTSLLEFKAGPFDVRISKE